MAPKDKKSKGAAGGKSGDEERDEPLQAVVCLPSPLALRIYALQSRISNRTVVLQILADPFETRFSPFTLERPRVSVYHLFCGRGNARIDCVIVLAAPRQHPAHRVYV
jgi:hypothetical protein